MGPGKVGVSLDVVIKEMRPSCVLYERSAKEPYLSALRTAVERTHFHISSIKESDAYQ